MTKRESVGAVLRAAARVAAAVVNDLPFSIVAAVFTVGLAAIVTAGHKGQGQPAIVDQPISGALLISVGVSFLAIVIIGAWSTSRMLLAKEAKLEKAEQAATENPAKPQLAWVAGQARLEKYLDRNLAQVRTIAFLTYTVMLIGFGFILYGLIKAFDDPTKLPVAIVSSASGILVSFIGGSFLIIYRSLLAQSREYLLVLERINGVGMSVAVLESIPDADAELRHKTTAELSMTLLTLYGARSDARLQRRKHPSLSSKSSVRGL